MRKAPGSGSARPVPRHSSGSRARQAPAASSSHGTRKRPKRNDRMSPPTPITYNVSAARQASSHGRLGRGYRYYRLIATTDGASPAIGHVRFWLTGARHYRNADRVVHLYNYLLSGARNALRNTDELRLVDSQATAESELIGPFQVPIPLTLSVTDGHTLVDADGLAIRDIVQPGTDFYLRPAPGTSGM